MAGQDSAGEPDDGAAAPFVEAERLRKAGDPAAALPYYRRALADDPGRAAAHAGHAQALWSLGERDAARAAMEAAARLAPRDVHIVFELARMLRDLGDLDASLAAYRALARLAPERAVIHNNLGNVHGLLGDAASALQSYSAAIRRDPGYALAYYNRGKLLREQGAYDAARADFDRVVALSPDMADGPYERSFCHLVDQRFAEGWRDYEFRWRSPTFLAESAAPGARALRERFDLSLEVQDLAGRRLLIVDEQGVGDTLMFASILPDVLALAAQASLICDRRLQGLFGQAFPALGTYATGSTPPDLAAYDHVLPIGSLARLFRSAAEAFPGRPYLAARPQVREAWARRLGPPAGKARIGLSWRGGIARTRQAERSMPLADLAPLLALPDCEFVSLQYGDPRAEVEAINAGLDRPIRRFEPAEIDDFEALAGLVQNLDLVVSVQTALVHLSGALGAPCFAMVPTIPEWRYLRAGAAMPWYGSVQLFRQGQPPGWAPVVAQVAQAAAARLGRPPAP